MTAIAGEPQTNINFYTDPGSAAGPTCAGYMTQSGRGQQLFGRSFPQVAAASDQSSILQSLRRSNAA